MKTYRDYAIITLDDDSIYKSETFKLLYDGYIENPNNKWNKSTLDYI